MRPILLAVLLLLPGCLTIETPKAKVRAMGAVKVVEVTRDGAVRVEDAGSPIQSFLNTLNTGLFAWLSGTFVR